MFYLKYGEQYLLNWSDTWGIYYITPSGIHAQFNAYQPADIVFYYEMNVAYSSSFGYMREMTFVKDGYQGPTTPPVINSSWAGRYTGQESDSTQVIFNLRADCTGDFKGAPFVAIFDGNKTLRFSLGNVNYAVVFDSVVTISYGAEVVTLTKGGDIQEVIPAGIAGTWTCSTVEGTNAGGTVYTVIIMVNGNISFQNNPLSNVKYNPATFVITASDAGHNYTFTYDASEGTLTIEWSDDESRSWRGVFTKAE